MGITVYTGVPGRVLSGGGGDYPLGFSVFIIHNEPIPFSLSHRSVTFKTGTHNL